MQIGLKNGNYSAMHQMFSLRENKEFKQDQPNIFDTTFDNKVGVTGFETKVTFSERFFLFNYGIFSISGHEDIFCIRM